MINLKLATATDLRWAQQMVTEHHYLYRPVDTRCSVEAYIVLLGAQPVGCLIFGRPEATRCYPWYGGVQDVTSGRAEVTRWQVLNLARVWLDPKVQVGGDWCKSGLVPGYTDRRGIWRSTLASDVIKAAAQFIGWEYLLRRPPCFLDEPYEIRWLMSYCDTRQHRGTIYQAAGFERYRVNEEGIETWRLRLPSLTTEEDAQVRQASQFSQRSQRYRARRRRTRMQLQPMFA